MKKNIAKLLVLALAVMSVMLAFASCGCSHEEKVIPKKDATCTEVGATEGKECAKCGEILHAFLFRRSQSEFHFIQSLGAHQSRHPPGSHLYIQHASMPQQSATGSKT